jgi:hypothetical protein
VPRAILKNGVIYPPKPLPPDWGEGKELNVQPLVEVVDDPEALGHWLDGSTL